MHSYVKDVRTWKRESTICDSCGRQRRCCTFFSGIVHRIEKDTCFDCLCLKMYPLVVDLMKRNVGELRLKERVVYRKSSIHKVWNDLQEAIRLRYYTVPSEVKTEKSISYEAQINVRCVSLGWILPMIETLPIIDGIQAADIAYLVKILQNIPGESWRCSYRNHRAKKSQLVD